MKKWQQPMDAEGPMASREELKNIMRFWLELGVDGFRLDAVTAELAATAPWLIAATFALGAVLLFLYDELLRRFARLYRRRKRG